VDGLKGAIGITDTNFHYLAVTKSGTNVIFYVDGSANVASSNYASVFQFNTVAGIGFRGDNTGNSFRGIIDELGFFNRALSPAEILALYNTTGKGMCSYPVSWLIQPTNQTAGLGSNSTFSASAAGSSPISYQWFLNGAPVAGGTNVALALSVMTFFQAGAYSVSASNVANSIISSNAILTLLSPPLLANGSFETGNFAGWITNDIASPFDPLAVRGAGFNYGCGFFC
jgi:hypothetical protein